MWRKAMCWTVSCVWRSHHPLIISYLSPFFSVLTGLWIHLFLDPILSSQQMFLEQGDRVANRWLMCALWMTSPGALGESVSKCSFLRAELAPWSSSQFEEGGKINTKPISTFSKQIQTQQVCRIKTVTNPYVLLWPVVCSKNKRYGVQSEFALSKTGIIYHIKTHVHVGSLIAAFGNYTEAQKCVNVSCDPYKSYPVACLKYYCAIMKYSNAASLLPAQWNR